jgi:abhydrolase domain-containing protein 6
MKNFFRILLILLLVILVAGCSSIKVGLYNLSISAERNLSGMKVSSLNVNGQTISYLERPGHGETIVLLHGFAANKDYWVRFSRNIPKKYRVIAFDLPGHGDSSRLENQTYDIDFITKGFTQAADALKLSTFHLAGNSMGGYVSMLYCVQNPRRVSTLCLIDPSGIQSPQKSDLQILQEQGKNLLIATTKDEYQELMKLGFYRQPFIPQPIISVLADKAIQDSAFNQKMWNDIRFHWKDALPLLPEIKPPTLLIWGDKDRIIHVSAAQVYENKVPNIETVIMKDCGHVPMVERPKETAGHYISFLKEHEKKI